eukprot:CAMPEP_0113940440 /NCGR_PEP_ID=MMETSP1339-20121228/6568_1 /TAXON_ID=94617 /ORGANISM="Fibrocapsa japonica" /LENGTH=225 /DNA_ID=CAMNT_0000944271 /DNA_START=56 /DNA_END=733 /DNA_ORIENTATION=+ /assembly_acc=CAM_ASM_000762
MASQHRRYYTPDDVAVHNSAEDCWVSIYHVVYDLSPLIKEHRGPLAQPIIDAAGRDISHWFDPKTKEVKTYVDEETDLTVPYTPRGRFVHVPPLYPSTSWATDFGTPWWNDDAYQIGKLTQKTRRINLLNVLSNQTTMLTVCSEDTMLEIQDRYLAHNAHAASYTWKRLAPGKGDDHEFVALDMEKTLEENGVEDEDHEFEKLGIDQDYYIPTLHLYFNDDLTIA